MAPIRGVLIDLGGVVYQGNNALPGAIEAIERLKAADIPFRFLTNTTSVPLAAIVSKLHSLDIPVSRGEIFTPVAAARAYIAAHDLEPHCLMRTSLREDFEGVTNGAKPAVIVADAREGFSYANMNAAFRQLEAGAELISLASNRMFVDDDGQLCLDVGAFVAALEYASGRRALVIGKPSPDFFHFAVADMGLNPGDVVMIGDDAEFDVAAACAAGLSGMLVKTGKWTPDAAKQSNLPPEIEFADLAAAVDAIVAQN